MTKREERKLRALLERPGGMARIVWRRLYREFRMATRAEVFAQEYRLLNGDPSVRPPTGILNA